MSDKYQGYSYSQLCEMLPLDDKQRSQVKPDMTIKQIVFNISADCGKVLFRIGDKNYKISCTVQK